MNTSNSHLDIIPNEDRITRKRRLNKLRQQKHRQNKSSDNPVVYKQKQKVAVAKHVIDYQNAKIYKICCKDVTVKECYIGSTTNLYKRTSQHKSICNSKNERCAGYNFNVYVFIRENGGWANWDLVIIEDFPCNTKHELHTRERFHIENLHDTLNKHVPSRTQKEYEKEYYRDNLEHIREYQKKYNKYNSEHSKKKYKDNAGNIKAQKKEYYQNNIVRIKALYSEKMPCIHCDKILSRGSMPYHIRKKHT